MLARLYCTMQGKGSGGASHLPHYHHHRHHRAHNEGAMRASTVRKMASRCCLSITLPHQTSWVEQMLSHWQCCRVLCLAPQEWKHRRPQSLPFL